MTRNVLSVHPETPLGEIVPMLLDRDFRAVPVEGNDHLVGIITNGDLVERGGVTAPPPTAQRARGTRAGA